MIQIPLVLLKSAYHADNGEPAWPMDDALKVIDWARRSGIAVLGVEIWLPTTPEPTIPTPFIYTQSVREIESETRDRFVERACAEAANYISHFDWGEADSNGLKTPYFNLTLDDGRAWLGDDG